MALNDKLRFRHGMRVHPNDVVVIARWPVVMAVLIEAGFMTDYPHEWTRDGRRVVRRHRSDDNRRRGWNCLAVLHDAKWKLYYRSADDRDSIKIKPDNRDAELQQQKQLGLLRGQVSEEEAIDADD